MATCENHEECFGRLWRRSDETAQSTAVLGQKFEDHEVRQDSKIESYETAVQVYSAMASDLNKKFLDLDRETSERQIKMELATISSAKSSEKTEKYMLASIFVTAGTFLGILVVVIGWSLTFSAQMQKENSGRQKMIESLQDKINQDAQNQRETISMMQKLYKKLGG
jgi:hypothetical protein